MTRRKRLARLIGRISVEVETALWAGLAAFIIFFITAVAPKIPEQVAIAERARIIETADENRRFCVKWGKTEGSQEHAACLLDLQELRTMIERRRLDQMAF
jgi:hypothetical protein